MTSPSITLSTSCQVGLTKLTAPSLGLSKLTYPLSYSGANTTINFAAPSCDFEDCCDWSDSSFAIVDSASLSDMSSGVATCCTTQGSDTFAFNIETN